MAIHPDTTFTACQFTGGFIPFATFSVIKGVFALSRTLVIFIHVLSKQQKVKGAFCAVRDFVGRRQQEQQTTTRVLYVPQPTTRIVRTRTCHRLVGPCNLCTHPTCAKPALLLHKSCRSCRRHYQTAIDASSRKSATSFRPRWLLALVVVAP